MNTNRRFYMIIAFALLTISMLACGGPVQPTPAPSTSTPPAPTTPQSPTALPATEEPVEPTPESAPPEEPQVIAPENVNGLAVAIETDLGTAINVLRVGPDGTIFAATDSGVLMLDPDTLQQIGVLAPGETTFDVTIAPDGLTAVTFPELGAARLWDVASQSEKTTLAGQLDGIYTSAAFSPDNTTLAVGGVDGIVSLWDTAAGVKIRDENVWQIAVDAQPDFASEYPEPVSGLSFSSDGARLMAQPLNGVILVLDVADSSPPVSYTAMGFIAGPVAYAIPAPDLNSYGWLSRGSFIVVDTAAQSLVAQFDHQDFLNGAVYSPDGRLVVTTVPGTVSATDTTLVNFWDIASGKQIAAYDAGAPTSKVPAFAPDGTQLVIWSSAGTIAVWRATEI